MSSIRPLPPSPRGVPWLACQLRCGVIAACLLTFFAQAAAAPPGAALKKFEEGTLAFAASNFAEALQLFQTSMELEPSPNTRFKIAKCYLALGRTASAYSGFRRAAKEAQDRIGATGEQRFAPTQAAAELEAAQLASLVPRVTLALPADLPPELLPEITLSLDGGALPAAIWASPIELDPGPHRLNASGPRIAPYEISFEMSPSENKRVELLIVRRKTGTLSLNFNKRPSGLSVLIDAQPVPPDQLGQPLILGLGLHKVAVSAPGYREFVAETTLHDQENLAVAVNLLPAPRYGGTVPRAAFFATGSGTLVLLGLGIGFGVQAQSTANDQLKIMDPLLRDSGVRDGVRTSATIANVAFGLGGALGLVTIGIAVVTRWRTPPARAPRPLAASLAPAPSLDLLPAAAQGEP